MGTKSPQSAKKALRTSVAATPISFAGPKLSAERWI